MRLRSLRPTKGRRAKRKSVDGLGRWSASLDRHIWLLRRAGIPATAIAKATARILQRHRRLRALAIPPLAVLHYSRVLTYWQHESRYLDSHGQPKPLPFDRGRISFKSLVRQALEKVDPSHVLLVFVRNRLVSQDRNGNIYLLEEAFVPTRSQSRAQALGYALMAVETVIDTNYATIRASKAKHRVGRFNRMAFAENFDPRFLPEYDLFQRETGAAFLALHNEWLKHHELHPTRGRRSRGRLVGISVSGILPRM